MSAVAVSEDAFLDEEVEEEDDGDDEEEDGEDGEEEEDGTFVEVSCVAQVAK